MSSYFFFDLDIPSYKCTRKEKKLESKQLCKFGFVDMLTRIHDYNVLENNPWFKNKPRSKKKKRVSFKPTEIFGRECVLPQCVEGSHVKFGYLHAVHCKNSLQETPEILGQHVWMNRQFLIKSRFG